jgi:hypothetical protein
MKTSKRICNCYLTKLSVKIDEMVLKLLKRIICLRYTQQWTTLLYP